MELSPASILAVKTHIHNPIQWKPDDEVLKKLKRQQGFTKEMILYFCVLRLSLDPKEHCAGQEHL